MIRVAAVQLRITPAIAENLERMQDIIRRVEADVICFPETCLQSEGEHARGVAAELSSLRTIARATNKHVIFGTYDRDRQGRVRNQIIVVRRDGGILLRYNKRHPHHTEPWVTPGSRNRVVDLDGTPIAVINCWDYSFPEELRALARKGAKVIFCPSYLVSHPRSGAVLPCIPQVRAFDTMTFFVMVDASADDAFGHTRICHPLREIAHLDQEGVIVADLNISEIDALRAEFNNL